MTKIGVDLVDIERFKLAVFRSGEPFLSKILTKHERDMYGEEEWAVLFSAKECMVKVMGGLPQKSRFQDIEVTLFLGSVLQVQLTSRLYEYLGISPIPIKGFYSTFDGFILTQLKIQEEGEFDE